MRALFFRAAVGAAAMAAASLASAQIVLYEHEDFGGHTIRAGNSVANLDDAGFNDRASSVRVRSGKWQLCDEAFFRGRCITLGPGEYPSLRSMDMNDRVSSVRELGWTPDGGGGWGDREDSRERGRWGGGGNWGSGTRAVLYSGVNFGGEAFVVEPRGVRNLDRADFNDRARSLRIESGYWIFCTDANFEGDCHTYGPGDYATLPGGQSHNISSGRRISEDYPYRDSPRWGGRDGRERDRGGSRWGEN